jgi:hypothetical protein
VPTGGLRLPAGKHAYILTDFQTINKEKMTKKVLFLPVPCQRAYRRFYQDLADVQS